eukprot:TRINITY_DN6534_c0_g1_i1.p1 TRINITY_DN6534_c0_g1~~TRINITY_DN6534_c0_g1_i1.p1  ORF type:complete len:716 (-),score=256.61 TRINITY_DN6534_c0_g1_i1:93-2240(-)
MVVVLLLPAAITVMVMLYKLVFERFDPVRTCAFCFLVVAPAITALLMASTLLSGWQAWMLAVVGIVVSVTGIVYCVVTLHKRGQLGVSLRGMLGQDVDLAIRLIWLYSMVALVVVTLITDPMGLSIPAAYQANINTILCAVAWWLSYHHFATVQYGTLSPSLLLFMGTLLFTHMTSVILICVADLSSFAIVDRVVLIMVAEVLPIAIGGGFAYAASLAAAVAPYLDDPLRGVIVKHLASAIAFVLVCVLPCNVVRLVDEWDEYTAVTDGLALTALVGVVMWTLFVLWHHQFASSPAIGSAALFATLTVLPANTMGVLGLYLTSSTVSTAGGAVMACIGLLPSCLFMLAALVVARQAAREWFRLCGGVLIGEQHALLRVRHLRIATISKRLTTLVFFLLAAFLVLAKGALGLTDRASALLLFMFIALYPFKVFLGHLRSMHRSKIKLLLLGVCCLLIPAPILFTLYMLIPDLSDVVWIEFGLGPLVLVLGVAAPSMCVMLGGAVLLGIKGDSFAIFSFLVCSLCFVPMVVLLPVLLAGKSNNEQVAVAVVSVPFMLGVTAFTIGVNIQAQLLQAERKAKLFCFKMRSALREHRVLIEQEVARYIYQKGVRFGAKPEMVAWLMAEGQGVGLKPWAGCGTVAEVVYNDRDCSTWLERQEMPSMLQDPGSVEPVHVPVERDCFTIAIQPCLPRREWCCTPGALCAVSYTHLTLPTKRIV